jgi:hypothetical protein
VLCQSIEAAMHQQGALHRKTAVRASRLSVSELAAHGAGGGAGLGSHRSAMSHASLGAGAAPGSPQHVHRIDSSDSRDDLRSLKGPGAVSSGGESNGSSVGTASSVPSLTDGKHRHESRTLSGRKERPAGSARRGHAPGGGVMA